VALRKLKPTSAGQRFVVRVVREGLHQGDPYEPLLEPFRKRGGRNNQGRITTRHQGGGHKRYYRVIDFKREKDGVQGQIERLEYDPNRTAYLALVLYSDVDAPIKPGSALPLKNIPIGSLVHCIEMKPGKGAQMARSAGASVQVVAREGEYVTVRLRSGEMRKVHVNCRATIGEVGNDEHNLRKIGKAGAQRWRGIRPTVRGVAQNPVDHPHGGGEGKSGQGNPHPVSPWGQKTKGYKTRRNKRTRSMIVRDRRQK
jgi:large subunit ribosomal protein L2